MNLLEMSIVLRIKNSIPAKLQKDFSLEEVAGIFDTEIGDIAELMMEIVGDIIVNPLGFDENIVNEKMEAIKASDEFTVVKEQISEKIANMCLNSYKS